MRRSLQVAFITGQSDPGRCALSPIQDAFLSGLAVPDEAKVRQNFPYDEGTLPYRDVSLAAASVSNTRHYRQSRRPEFADAYGPPMMRLLDRADQTVLLAGSCGLELLGNLPLPASALARLHVFAYGPVARRAPGCDVCVVRARGDWVSLWWRGRVDHVVDGGHLDYLENPQVRALCEAFIARVQSHEGGEVR